MIDFVVESELREGRSRVAAANNCEGFGIGHCLGNRARAGGETVIFEHAHRAVPEHGARIHDDVAERCRRARPNVEAFGSFGKARAVGTKDALGVESHDVFGKMNGLARREQALACLDLIWL